MTQTTICMINQKGGCGKSATCFHLSGYFAEIGLSVLLVDADPQGSLSQGFFGPSLVEGLRAHHTLASVFEEELFLASTPFLPLSTPFDRIAIVPANQTLAPHNMPNPERKGMQQCALRSYLDELSDFDVVLIDCPPNLYLCSWNAMVAADYAIVPVNPEDFGTQGLPVVHQAIDNVRRLNPSLCLLGHLVTRSDRRLLVHQAYQAKLRELYGRAVFDTVIPEASAFKVAIACREPITLHSPRSGPAHLFRKLGAEIRYRITIQTRNREVA